MLPPIGLSVGLSLLIYNIRKVLSCDSFQFLSKILHFSDNSSYIPRSQQSLDHLIKICPIVNYLISCFKSSYVLDPELSIINAWLMNALKCKTLAT